MRNGVRKPAVPLRTRLSDDGGFALPTVLLMTFAGFAVAMVAVLASLNAQGGITHDYDTKDALAGAEAGVHEAMLRYNATNVQGGSWGTCLPTGTTESMGGMDWCPAQTGSLPDGTTYTYRVGFPQRIPGAPLPPHTAQIVSEGNTSGATRRVDVTIRSASGQKPFPDAGIIGRDKIHLNTNSGLYGNAATNGDITLDGNDTFCGNAEVGPGRNVLPVGTVPSCGGSVTQGVTSLPPVNQGDVNQPGHNANGNFFAVNPVVSGSPSRACFNGYNATGAVDSSCGSPGSRELVLSRGQSAGAGLEVTLNGGDYSLCRLELQQGTKLSVANGAQVTIYFDSPENCGYSDGAVQLNLAQFTSILSNGGDATHVSLLFVGSETLSTKAIMASNTSTNPGIECNQDFVVYGPLTDIVMQSNSFFCGAIAGKTIDISSNTTVRTSNQAQEYQLPGWVDHYAIDDFKECAGTMPAGASSPNSGC